MSGNKEYYGKLSEMLEDVIRRRKIGALSYAEYLRQVEEMAQRIVHPEVDGAYPEAIKDSAAKRAIFDHLSGNADLALALDKAIRVSLRPGWKDNRPKQKEIQGAINHVLLGASYTESQAQEETEALFELVKQQPEYDQ